MKWYKIYYIFYRVALVAIIFIVRFIYNNIWLSHYIPIFNRTIWILGLQIHPLRSCTRSLALPIPTSSRKQGCTQKDQEGKASSTSRNPSSSAARTTILQTQRKLRSHINYLACKKQQKTIYLYFRVKCFDKWKRRFKQSNESEKTGRKLNMWHMKKCSKEQNSKCLSAFQEKGLRNNVKKFTLLVC